MNCNFVSEYPKKRGLDGCYFRVERGGKFENVCFTDLSLDERDTVCENRSEAWLKALIMYLADRLRGIGDEFYLEDVDEDE